MHADVGEITGTALDLVFAEPVVGSFVEKNAATVGVDVDTVVVGPDFAGDECFESFRSVAGSQSCGEEDAEQ